MILILDFREGILEVLPTSKRDLHQNPRSSALRCEIYRSTQHGSPFSHALNPQVAGGDGRGSGVKTASVIGDHHLHIFNRTRESIADLADARMPCHVGIGLLSIA